MIGDTMVLVCHVILQDHVTKQSCPKSNIKKLVLALCDFEGNFYLIRFFSFEQSKLIYATP